MNSILLTVQWLLALAVMVPLGWFALEVLVGLLPPRKETGLGSGARAAVLIPAHDEALGIAETVTRLITVAPPGTRVLVVADNCSDATAAAARNAGAEVIERSHETLRGKGFALDFGRAHLALDPPDAVIVMDADCRMAPGSVEALTTAALDGRGPAQALNLIAPDRAASPLVQISSFAMLVKNMLRFRGMGRLGGSVTLCGTGMGFAWRDFAEAHLATGDIVEDLGLGIDMVRRGRRTRLIESARITSAPAGVAESVSQRSRWEHGFLSTALHRAVPTLWHGLSRFNRAEIALGMHLLVPPLALLFLLAFAMLAVLAGLAWLTGYWLAVQALALTVLAAGGLVVLAWALAGREVLSLKALLQAPLYVLWKLPIYLKFIKGPETSWVRTGREGE